MITSTLDHKYYLSMRILFLLFLIMPILEVMVLLKVADGVGWLSTIALVVLTAVIGINILKQQGFSTLTRANQKLEAGQLPAKEIMEGFCLAIGGALLLTPGFITDSIGFLLLIGPSRRAIIDFLVRNGMVKMQGQGGFSSFHYQSQNRSWQQSDSTEGDVLEGEFTREQPENPRLDPQDKQ